MAQSFLGLRRVVGFTPVHPHKRWARLSSAGSRSGSLGARPPSSRGDVSELVASWLEIDPSEDSRSVIEDLLERGEEEEIFDRLGSRLQIGTAGLRGLDGAGFNRVNSVTVQQITQGLCRYLKETFGLDALLKKGVVVGFDGRKNSRLYADVVANVFLSKGIVVRKFSEVVPTPFVAFGVTHLDCLAGVMITASHNAKEYNGIKLYWENGCQIIPPHDAMISSQIDDNLQLWDLTLPSVHRGDLETDPLEIVSKAYHHSIMKKLHFSENVKETPKIVYSPLHGVGRNFVKQAFFDFGIHSLVVVPEQEFPDPDFPTVTFPNPEEGSGVFDLGFKTAENVGARVVLINDPDADRLSAAEKINGEWRIFSGNEIGLLLGHWMWENTKLKGPTKNPENFAMIGTVVSSKMLSRLASREGFQFHQTLTGFKWLGNKVIELQNQGVHVLLAFEEAIGFMLDGPIMDKDGVSAAVVFGEMVATLNSRGLSVAEHLSTITAELGNLEYRSGYFRRTPKESKQFFARLRENQSYPSSLGGVSVEFVRDMGTGMDSSRADGMTDLPWRKGDLMVTFGLKGDGWVTLRASGTEPKLKYYLEVGDTDGRSGTDVADKLVEEIRSWVL